MIYQAILEDDKRKIADMFKPNHDTAFFLTEIPNGICINKLSITQLDTLEKEFLIGNWQGRMPYLKRVG